MYITAANGTLTIAAPQTYLSAPSNANVIPCAIGSKKITIAPNSFLNSLQATLQVQKEERAVVTVMDIFGREIKSKVIQLFSGKNQVSIDGLEKLPAGNYLLRVATRTGVETVKIIKQE